MHIYNKELAGEGGWGAAKDYFDYKGVGGGQGPGNILCLVSRFLYHQFVIQNENIFFNLKFQKSLILIS